MSLATSRNTQPNMTSIREWLVKKRESFGAHDFPPSSPSLMQNAIEPNITRSLSSRARLLGRRVSSITRPSRLLCSLCRDLSFCHISEELRNSPFSPNGIFLGWLPDNPNGCSLCLVLSQIRAEPQAAAESKQSAEARLQLRAFHLLPHMAELLTQDFSSKLVPPSFDVFVAVVPDHLSLLPGGPDEAMIRAVASKNGFLVYTDQETSIGRILSPRLVPPDFDPDIVKHWLRACQSHHGRCIFERRREPSLHLIDCQSQTILNVSDIESGSCPDYVALSYVWGASANQRRVISDGCVLPHTLPQVVHDSIQVTLMLGYRYLWVDKYCVESQDKAKKHEQLMHMDSVYQNAALTIVAAAGQDESYGLPGISKRRTPQQIVFKGKDFTLMSTLPLPHKSITDSRWASRGWTYQEAILSRRCLVFTDDQLYFECNSMSCCESFNIERDGGLHKMSPDLLFFTQPSLFSLKQLPFASVSNQEARLSNFFTYVNCTKEYSRRALSYDHDSLSAFSGIIRMLESVTVFPVRHIWGSPFFHPDDDNLPTDILESTYQNFQLAPFWKSPVIDYGSLLGEPRPSGQGVDYLAFLLLGLSWQHDSTLGPPRRRTDLPSWSWTGWQGAVTWPQFGQTSTVRTLPWMNTTVSLGDSSTESVPTMYHKTTDAHILTQSNKSLYIRTLEISRTAFVLVNSSNTLSLSTGYNVRLYPSKRDLDAPKVLRRIHSDRYKVIVLGSVDQDTYMMLTKKYRHSYYRIGTMVVNTAYLIAPLFTSQMKTYKLR
ncbi:heterokaryon incompatibility protein-domain-containing protein [Nemania sp. FL0031]|nr:heterokaryon incompatibility protein-domain-containing protein [Nemania sp. FL0031]